MTNTTSPEAQAHLTRVLDAIHARPDGDEIFATGCALINMAAAHKDESAGKLAIAFAGSEVAANGFAHARKIEAANSELRLLDSEQRDG